MACVFYVRQPVQSNRRLSGGPFVASFNELVTEVELPLLLLLRLLLLNKQLLRLSYRLNRIFVVVFD